MYYDCNTGLRAIGTGPVIGIVMGFEWFGSKVTASQFSFSKTNDVEVVGQTVMFPDLFFEVLVESSNVMYTY